MTWRTLGSAGVVAAALLVAPATAPAATTCDYASQVLQVDLGASGDQALLTVVAGGEIEVRQTGGTVVACTGGPPTTTNTNAISVFNHPGLINHSITISGAGDFAPGATAETGDDEIEIFPTLNDASGSTLQVVAAAAGNAIRFGDAGINPNATAGEGTPDADIFPAGVLDMRGFGGDGADTLSAQGGAGTGNALTDPILLQGSQGTDVVTGGEGGDTLFGGADADSVFGMGAVDALAPGGGDDVVDGGAGSDIGDYGSSETAVRVDLAVSGPQDTGGSDSDSLTSVENLRGTPFSDVLLGDGGPNILDGFSGGDDRLVGRGGVDALTGRNGADMLDARDGGLDTADCGDGTDQVTTDAPGVDTITGCEATLFPVAPALPGPGTARDRTPARLTAFTLSRKRFRARTGTRMRFRLSERATVRFTVERLRRGRYRRLKGGLSRRGRAGRNSFKFSGRWRGRRLRVGRYRLVATATDGARNRSKPKRVKFRVVR